VKDKLLLSGHRLVVLSALLFALSIPISIALDGVAAGIGILGILISLMLKDFKNYPPIKPLLLFLIPEAISSLISFPRKILKTDLNHQLATYFVVYKAIVERKGLLNKILIILSFSSLILALSVIFQAFTWQDVKHINLQTLTFHLNPTRAKGLLNHALTTAGVIYLLAFLFLGWFFQRKKIYFLLVSAVLFFSLILTESRSYWLGTLFAIFILSVMQIKRNWKPVLAVWSIILISAGLLFQTPVLKNRLVSITNTKNYWSNLDRLILWRAHTKAFLEDYSLKEKIIGSGYRAPEYAWKHFLQSFRETVKSPPPKNLKAHFHGGETHNIYLKFLTKYGILGLIGYISFWIYVILLNFKALKRTDSLFPIVSSLTSCYIGFMLAGFFENNFTDAEVKYALMFILGINLAMLKKPEILSS